MPLIQAQQAKFLYHYFYTGLNREVNYFDVTALIAIMNCLVYYVSKYVCWDWLIVTSVSLPSLRLYVRFRWMSVVKMLAYSEYSSRTSLKPFMLMYCRSQYVSAFTSAFVLITWFWLGRSEPIRSPFPVMTSTLNKINYSYYNSFSYQSVYQCTIL